MPLAGQALPTRCARLLPRTPESERLMRRSILRKSPKKSFLSRIPPTASSRDVARTRPSRRSELAEQVDSAKQSQHRRIEVKSSGERRLAESPEGLPGALTHGPDLLPSGSRRAALKMRVYPFQWTQTGNDRKTNRQGTKKPP